MQIRQAFISLFCKDGRRRSAIATNSILFVQIEQWNGDVFIEVKSSQGQSSCGWRFPCTEQNFEILRRAGIMIDAPEAASVPAPVGTTPGEGTVGA